MFLPPTNSFERVTWLDPESREVETLWSRWVKIIEYAPFLVCNHENLTINTAKPGQHLYLTLRGNIAINAQISREIMIKNIP